MGVVFSTALGHVAVAVRQGAAVELTFGWGEAAEAWAALRRRRPGVRRAARARWPEWERLAAYAAGEPDSLDDIPVILEGFRPFGLAVLRACRDVGYGELATYGTLAARAGRPRAARAAGRILAANPLPLIIPCHRVIAADGSLGGYSAPAGLAMKRRLLALEGSLPGVRADLPETN